MSLGQGHRRLLSPNQSNLVRPARKNGNLHLSLPLALLLLLASANLKNNLLLRALLPSLKRSKNEAEVDDPRRNHFLQPVLHAHLLPLPTHALHARNHLRLLQSLRRDHLHLPRRSRIDLLAVPSPKPLPVLPHLLQPCNQNDLARKYVVENTRSKRTSRRRSRKLRTTFARCQLHDLVLVQDHLPLSLDMDAQESRRK